MCVFMCERESECVCECVCVSLLPYAVCAQFVKSVSHGYAHRGLGHVRPDLHPPLQPPRLFPLPALCVLLFLGLFPRFNGAHP